MDNITLNLIPLKEIRKKVHFILFPYKLFLKKDGNPRNF